MSGAQLREAVAADVKVKLTEQCLPAKRWLFPLSCCAYIERQRATLGCEAGFKLLTDPHRSFALDFTSLLDQFVDEDPSYGNLEYTLEELRLVLNTDVLTAPYYHDGIEQ